MHGFVFKQVVDLLQFLFLERPKNNTWGGEGHRPLTTIRPPVIPAPGSRADITVDDDQSVFHPTANTRLQRHEQRGARRTFPHRRRCRIRQGP